VFDPIFSDIDGEAGDELICLLGWDIGCPYLCVFKQQQNGWYLIYFENIHTYYSAPTLSIANNFSKNKVFYYRQVDGHGSDVYFDSYHFYKLIDGKVYKCLNLSNEQRDYGSKLWMSKEIEMNFEFGGDESDGVGVNYTYNFFSGGVEPLIKDEINVSYKWSNRNKKYQIDIYPFQNEEDNLIDKKIDFFNSSGEDSLFVTAFKDKIDKLLKEGSPRQKQALNNYLIEQKKEQKQLHQTNH